MDLISSLLLLLLNPWVLVAYLVLAHFDLAWRIAHDEEVLAPAAERPALKLMTKSLLWIVTRPVEVIRRAWGAATGLFD